MKKLILLPLLALFAFASCSDDKDKEDEQTDEVVKLVKQIVLDWGEDYFTETFSFEYDNQERVKTVLRVNALSDGDYIETYNYSYGNNTITVDCSVDGIPTETGILTFDNDGFLIQMEERYDGNSDIYTYSYSNGYLNQAKSNDGYTLDYKWQNGNLVYRDGEQFTYNSIENKLNVNDRLYIEELHVKGSYFLKLKGVNNNATFPASLVGYVTYQYDIDEDGYPTKMTSTENCTVTFLPIIDISNPIPTTSLIQGGFFLLFHI